MANYKKDFCKDEDYSLWELHEIRHEIYKDFGLNNYKKINELGKALFKQIKSPLEKIKSKNN
ncbi:hypothetical protein HY745_15355 [Candidatus Desantisbacteria bacterium]|nr:hypothetical protein [Candidatus Desantisbacteria bacterium]